MIAVVDMHRLAVARATCMSDLTNILQEINWTELEQISPIQFGLAERFDDRGRTLITDDAVLSDITVTIPPRIPNGVPLAATDTDLDCKHVKARTVLITR